MNRIFVVLATIMVTVLGGWACATNTNAHPNENAPAKSVANKAENSVSITTPKDINEIAESREDRSTAQIESKADQFSSIDQGDFPSIDAFLKSNLKGKDRLSFEARGDLNDDGLEDWTGVIEKQNSDSSPTHQQLYVLVRLSQGGYKVAEKSKEAEIVGVGCCWIDDLNIDRSSIYIQDNAKTASTIQAAHHQFKLYKGEWRLIGLRVLDIDRDSDVSIDTDMNLLTGAVIEKKQKGEGKPTTKTRSKKFGTYLLKDFDFSNGFGTE